MPPSRANHCSQSIMPIHNCLSIQSYRKAFPVSLAIITLVRLAASPHARERCILARRGGGVKIMGPIQGEVPTHLQHPKMTRIGFRL